MKNDPFKIFVLIIISIVLFLSLVYKIRSSLQNDNYEKVELQVVENNINKEIIEPEKNIPDVLPQDPTVAIKPKKITPPFVCPKPEKDYADMWLLPIGQNTSLPDTTYIPNGLEKLNLELATKSNICLIKNAHDSFEAMAKQALKDGISIKVSSGFRSYETQKATLEAEVKSGNPDAYIAVAKAGYSEHQLGTAIDITGQSIQYVSASKSFEKTPEANWVEENASDYGFVESYPLGKESITGYQYEPWHYRYVGIDTAKEIIKSGKTINEYLESLQKN